MNQLPPTSASWLCLSYGEPHLQNGACDGDGPDIAMRSAMPPGAEQGVEDPP